MARHIFMDVTGPGEDLDESVRGALRLKTQSGRSAFPHATAWLILGVSGPSSWCSVPRQAAVKPPLYGVQPANAPRQTVLPTSKTVGRVLQVDEVAFYPEGRAMTTGEFRYIRNSLETEAKERGYTGIRGQYHRTNTGRVFSLDKDF